MNIVFNLVLFGVSGAVFAFAGACLNVSDKNGNDERQKYGVAVFALILNSIAILCFFFVLIPAVPAAAKGGLFGAAGGIVAGAFLFTSMLSWEIIGESLGHRMRGVIGQADDRATREN